MMNVKSVMTRNLHLPPMYLPTYLPTYLCMYAPMYVCTYDLFENKSITENNFTNADTRITQVKYLKVYCTYLGGVESMCHCIYLNARVVYLIQCMRNSCLVLRPSNSAQNVCNKEKVCYIERPRFFLKNGPTPASLHLFSVISNKQYKFYNKSM